MIRTPKLGGFGRGKPVNIVKTTNDNQTTSNAAIYKNIPSGLGGIGRGKPMSEDGECISIPGLYHDCDDYEDASKVCTNAFDCLPRIRQDIVRLKSVYPKLTYLNDRFFTIRQRVQVSYMENPGYFCIQTFGQRSLLNRTESSIHQSIIEENDELEMDINRNYKGSACAVFINNMWRRGYVMDTNFLYEPRTPQGYLAKVMLVDYGNYGWISMNEMSLLPREWLKVAPMAFLVVLYGPFWDSTKAPWPKRLLEEFGEMINDKDLTTVFTDIKDPVEVTLDAPHLCDNCKERCTINERMERLVREYYQRK